MVTRHGSSIRVNVRGEGAPYQSRARFAFGWISSDILLLGSSDPGMSHQLLIAKIVIIHGGFILD